MGYVPHMQWETSHSPAQHRLWDNPHTMEPETLATRLDRLIHEDGRSRSAVSVAAGLGRTAARDIIEERSRSPGYDTIAAFARVLGVSPEYLACKTNDREGATGEVVTPQGETTMIPSSLAEAMRHANEDEHGAIMALAERVLLRVARQSRSGPKKKASS